MVSEVEVSLVVADKAEANDEIHFSLLWGYCMPCYSMLSTDQ